MPDVLPLCLLNSVPNLSLAGFQIGKSDSQNLAARESGNVGFSSPASAARRHNQKG